MDFTCFFDLKYVFVLMVLLIFLLVLSREYLLGMLANSFGLIV
jgi:hypothetical protein